MDSETFDLASQATINLSELTRIADALERIADALDGLTLDRVGEVTRISRD
jgi:hypothetical protein